jgi:D-alanyl-D-alanine carboxypeptidase
MRNFRDKVPIPLVTAETWCIIDTDSGGKLLNGKLANHKREVASLTKMMTFLVSWQLF